MIDRLTISKLLAYFIISLASYVGHQHCRLIDEAVILVSLFRKLLCKKSAALDNGEQRWMTGATPGLPVEYTGEKNSDLSLSPSLLDHFLEEFFPSFLTESRR